MEFPIEKFTVLVTTFLNVQESGLHPSRYNPLALRRARKQCPKHDVSRSGTYLVGIPKK